MENFVRRFRDGIYGVLSGFDRIRFRGTQRLLASLRGLTNFLAFHGVLHMDFKKYVTGVTDTLREQVESAATAAGHRIEYLNDPGTSKEDVAARIAKRAGIDTGLRAVLSAVEPCRTFYMGTDPATGHLVLRQRLGKCLHYYHYWRDERLGPCHVRLQTWFPFNVFVCVNGREMLAARLARLGMKYRQRDNCFTWVEDVTAAQGLLDEQVRMDWAAELTRLLTASHPQWTTWPGMDRPYYWSAQETEWATDVMFRSRAELARRMPGWVRHSLIGLGSTQAMRFLGRPLLPSGQPHRRFLGEVATDYVRRPEGVRVAFSVNRNRVKFYDKQGSVFRVETIINDARDMKSYRAAESDPDGPKAWRPMKKGVSDLPRRTQVSQNSNARCLEALAAVETEQTLGAMTDRVCRRTTWKKRPVRALNPLGDDLRLLRAVGRGEFLLNGFRNRDLRELLYEKPPCDDLETKRRSGAVTRKIRLLRAHGIIRKVSGTHRYQVTKRGRELLAGLTAAHAAHPHKLQSAA